MIRAIDVITYPYYSSYNMCLCHKVMSEAYSHFGINLINFYENTTFFCFSNLFNALLIYMFPVLKISTLT